MLQALPKLKPSVSTQPLKKWTRIHLGTRTIYQKERRDHLCQEIKNNCLNPNQKIVTINQKVNIVRTKGIATESKAQQTRKNLINLGFKNSFIQFPLNQPS